MVFRILVRLSTERRRRERVPNPARDLIRRQRAVEAARPGHLVYLLVVRRRRAVLLRR